MTAHFGPLTPEFTRAESSTDGVALAWSNLAWAVRYNIYRAPSSQMPDTALATVVADGTCEYFDASGEVGQIYWYWVEAVGATDTCTVTIVCATPNAVIYYSTNGRTPSIAESYRYTGSFAISKTTTVKAVGQQFTIASLVR